VRKLVKYNDTENLYSCQLYMACLQADVQLLKKGHGKPGEMAEKAAEVLMGCFRVCAGDTYVTLCYKCIFVK